MFNYTETEVTPQNVFIFGCGGTGSRTIPPLLQLLKAHSNWLLNPSIYLIDGDDVEEKNCSRQHFIQQDVGKNKAEVLAHRYSTAYNIPVSFYPKFFSQHRDEIINNPPFMTSSGSLTQSFRDSSRDSILSSATLYEKTDLYMMMKFLTSNNKLDLKQTLLTAKKLHWNPEALGSTSLTDDVRRAKSIAYDPCVVILCVDSAEARRNILVSMTAFNPSRKMFVIDAGNEDIYGQVMFYRFDHRAPLRDKSFRDEIDKIFTGQTDGIDPLAKSLAHVSRLKVEDEDLRLLSRDIVAAKRSRYDNSGRVKKYYIMWSTQLKKGLEAIDETCVKDLVGNLSEQQDELLLQEQYCPDVCSVSMPIPILPCPDLFYDTLQDGESTRSCADLDQTLAINNLMSAAILNVVNNLIYGLPFDFHTIRISLDGGYATEKMTPYWFKQMILGNDNRYSSYLIKSAYEKVMYSSNMEKDEARSFILNYMKGNYEYRYHRLDVGLRDSWEDIVKVFSSATGKRTKDILELLENIYSLTDSAYKDDESEVEGRKRDIITKVEALDKDQSNLMIDLILYLEVFHSYYSSLLEGEGCYRTNTGIISEGLFFIDRFFGMDVFTISSSQTCGMTSNREGCMLTFLTEYLCRAYAHKELSIDAFRDNATKPITDDPEVVAA